MNKLRTDGICILGCEKVVSSHIYQWVKCRRYRRTAEVQQMEICQRREQRHPLTIHTVVLAVLVPLSKKEERKQLRRYGLLFTYLCSRSYWKTGRFNNRCIHECPSNIHSNQKTCLPAEMGSGNKLYGCKESQNFLTGRNHKVKHAHLRLWGCSDRLASNITLMFALANEWCNVWFIDVDKFLTLRRLCGLTYALRLWLLHQLHTLFT